jgi:hypothetical protein
MTTENPNLEQCYQLLNLSVGASLEEVDAVYLKLSYQKLSEGDRKEAAAIKAAYKTLKAHLEVQTVAEAELQEQLQAAAADPSNLLRQRLQQQGWQAQVSVRGQQLHIAFKGFPTSKSRTVVAQIYTLLEQADLSQLGLTAIATVSIYGLNAASKPIWKKSFPMPQRGLTADDYDLFSFNNRFSNAIVFPALLLLGMMLNAMPMTKFLLRGISIWIHEFGHATIAWLSGRRAIPLPFGWTNYSLERSFFVYLGVLTLLGLLFWAGWKQQKRWPMSLAGILALVQFYMTWLMPGNTFGMLEAFGGIGGEFYLSTLLVVSFYFPMPEYWRWDFWRYPAILAAAFTFWGISSLWRDVKRGLENIPWGSLWGGQGDAGGDMNQLREQFGWSDRQIVDTYNFLGGLCLTTILGVYFYFLIKQNRFLFFALWQRCLAEPGKRVKAKRDF